MIRRVVLSVPLLVALVAVGCRDEAQTPAYLVAEYGVRTADRPVLCHDGEDNDEDGLTDCVDADCSVACVEGEPDDLSTCLDGIDNDEDGRSDCSDDLCKANQGCCPPMDQRGFENDLETCSDGLDNNCNGYIDCADNSCRGLPDVPFCEGTDANCADGVDNDGNGYTDCQDFGCSKNTSVTVCP